MPTSVWVTRVANYHSPRTKWPFLSLSLLLTKNNWWKKRCRAKECIWVVHPTMQVKMQPKEPKGSLTSNFKTRSQLSSGMQVKVDTGIGPSDALFLDFFIPNAHYFGLFLFFSSFFFSFLLSPLLCELMNAFGTDFLSVNNSSKYFGKTSQEVNLQIGKRERERERDLAGGKKWNKWIREAHFKGRVKSGPNKVSFFVYWPWKFAQFIWC